MANKKILKPPKKKKIQAQSSYRIALVKNELSVQLSLESYASAKGLDS